MPIGFKRNSNSPVGMGDPGDNELIQELQENVQRMAARIEALENADSSSTTQVVQQARIPKFVAGDNVTITQTAARVNIAALLESGSSLEAFEVVAEYGDYLECLNGTATVYVAKPWMLRRSPFDGLTVNGVSYEYSAVNTRTASNDDDSETQVITPDYFAGEVILVVGRSTGITTDAGLSIEWEDVNTAGRCWATIGVT